MPFTLQVLKYLVWVIGYYRFEWPTAVTALSMSRVTAPAAYNAAINDAGASNLKNIEDVQVPGRVLHTTSTSLVIVCCHAIFNYGPGREDPLKESNWLLQSFQKGSPTKAGEHETFLAHIKASLQYLLPPLEDDKDKPQATVVFSGGHTKQDLTKLSEAKSYLLAAKALANSPGGLPDGIPLQKIILEEKATDSYQNLIFSVAEFRKVNGHYPSEITIITHAFKQRRFLDLHAKAIRWPDTHVHVLGIDPVQSPRDQADTVLGETTLGYKAWVKDPYGCHGNLLQKRIARGWNEALLQPVSQGLESQVVSLLAWKGGETGLVIFPEVLPWER